MATIFAGVVIGLAVAVLAVARLVDFYDRRTGSKEGV